MHQPSNKQYSKYEWKESTISDENMETILRQMEDGNIFVLTDEEFWVLPRTRDLKITVGYYKDEKTHTHHHKVTNDTRRMIIKSARFREIVDQDSEKCQACGSIDCSTCMQLNRGSLERRTGYIVICHSCGHKSNYR